MSSAPYVIALCVIMKFTAMSISTIDPAAKVAKGTFPIAGAVRVGHDWHGAASVGRSFKKE